MNVQSREASCFCEEFCDLQYGCADNDFVGTLPAGAIVKFMRKESYP